MKLRSSKDDALLLVPVVVFVVLSYFVSGANFLFFHIIIEFVVILTAFGISVLTLTAGDKVESGFLRFIGSAFLWIGILELFHTLTYRGMNIFVGLDSNHPTQFWIAARWMEVITFILALLWRKSGVVYWRTSLVYALVTTFVIYVIMMTSWFPDCYIEGEGLTNFKKISEYLISGIFLLLMLHFMFIKKDFSNDIRRQMVLALLFAGLAEIFFTFYINVYGISNYIGHVLKIISVVIIFRAIVHKGIREPQDILYYDLLQKEEALKAALEEKEVLMREIHHRVKNSLALVASFIAFESKDDNGSECGKKLNSLKERIKSVLLIHEQLSSTGEVGQLDFSVYVKDLVDNLFLSADTGEGRIKWKVDIPQIIMSAKKAMSLGIIINEIVTNSIKYAFPDNRNGTILITMKRLTDKYELIIEDDGVGSTRAKKAGSSGLGKMIIASLVEQLEGTLNVLPLTDVDKVSGTGYLITIPV
ncbi:MAG TPA: MASE3 domain-containing protein [Spirochaetota bacterium]|nr:MASE3 domain-containing protein [Spirochaetota bacterium]